MISNLIQLTYLKFIIIVQNIHYYNKSIEKLVRGHLERAVIEFDKLAAPLSLIEFQL
jgi:thymidylate synthase